ncbi:hypothetical protein [Algivirga pacifica]|uniref:Uncharacterized protein n=1 Tax=Algivirga pacifica TaxID=1162670 RepID=A0ABP9DE49_9BACT
MKTLIYTILSIFLLQGKVIYSAKTAEKQILQGRVQIILPIANNYQPTYIIGKFNKKLQDSIQREYNYTYKVYNPLYITKQEVEGIQAYNQVMRGHIDSVCSCDSQEEIYNLYKSSYSDLFQKQDSL